MRGSSWYLSLNPGCYRDFPYATPSNHLHIHRVLPRHSIWVCYNVAIKHVVNRHKSYIFTSPPIGGGRGIVMPMSVCVFVCLCVCPCFRKISKCNISAISQPIIMKLGIHITHGYTVTDKYFQNFRSKVKVVGRRKVLYLAFWSMRYSFQDRPVSKFGPPIFHQELDVMIHWWLLNQ